MIDGITLRNAIISGSNSIVNVKHSVDELNIFPVPDGDTGTNMSMTISAGAKALAALDGTQTVGEVAAAAASALLRGARGNSGVILSLLFRGFAQGLKGLEQASGFDIANALALGVDAAYKAVMKPTEGTILTVARVAAEKAHIVAMRDNDAQRIWTTICDAAEEALATTPDLLPVLKRANVVDAGGKGLCVIFEGMQSVIRDGVIVPLKESDGKSEASSDTDMDNFKSVIGQFDEVINFTYCTEFIVGRQNQNDPAELRAYLETIGDCVVVVDDEEIIKVHVHTDNPGFALTKAIEFGQFLTVKVENMREQNKNAKAAAAPKAPEYCAPTEDRVAFISVAAGDGLTKLFKDELGCDFVVSGGQTMNPSTEDILAAVQATNAKTVFVLPNNKNIIMAAEQVVPIADRRVVVLPTRTVPQGIRAMLSYNPEDDIDTNAEFMLSEAQCVSTGTVTYAARNSEFGGKKITEGDILGLDNGKLVFTESDPVKAVVRLAKMMVTRDTAMVTLIFGDSVDAVTASEAAELLAQKLGRDIEISVVDGGQPVYHFIISIE